MARHLPDRPRGHSERGGGDSAGRRLLIALFTLPAIGPVSPQALTYSLTREADGDLWSTEIYTCKRGTSSKES